MTGQKRSQGQMSNNWSKKVLQQNKYHHCFFLKFGGFSFLLFHPLVFSYGTYEAKSQCQLWTY